MTVMRLARLRNYVCLSYQINQSSIVREASFRLLTRGSGPYRATDTALTDTVLPNSGIEEPPGQELVLYSECMRVYVN